MALSHVFGPTVTHLIRHCMLFQYGTGQIVKRQAAADPRWFRAGTVEAPKPPPQFDPTSYPIEDELKLLESAYEGRVTILYVTQFDPHAPDKPTPVEQRILEMCRTHHWSCVTSRKNYAAIAAQI
jgi:hypothetical protein